MLEIIWDFKKLNKTLKELNIDTEKNPLGRLKLE
jgi:poly [ADP-ribose] polymerase 2/3/4